MDTPNTKTTRGNERLQAVINNHHHEDVQLQDRSRSSTQEGGFIVQKQQAKSLAAFSSATESGTDVSSKTQLHRWATRNMDYRRRQGEGLEKTRHFFN